MGGYSKPVISCLRATGTAYTLWAMRTVYSKPPKRGPARVAPESSDTDTPAARVLLALREHAGSARRWALGRGYPPRAVLFAIHTWAGRTDRRPHGGQARDIMDALRADLGPELVPPVAPPDERAVA